MKKILLSILSTLASLTILYGQANEFNYPDMPDTSSSRFSAVGGIDGTFNVSPIGGATFSIPIDAPLGVGCMQPNLSIVYNSQSGNGIAGWGCNISGLSVITRGPKNIYHDGTAKPLTYMTDDAFYLDGKRLIYDSSGTDGLDGTVFYPESDPFTKVIVHGTYNTSTTNLWLEVQAPNGMKYYYGNTTSGRLSYTSGSSPRIYAWYLDYAEDPLGNTMSYTYSNTDNFMRPNTIIYGANKNSSTGLSNTITFSYESRSDVTPFFLEGNIKGQMNYRLKTITAKTGSNTYCNYDLMYNNTNDGTATKYSRLIGVTVKNAAGETLNPITLNWTYLPSFSGSVSQPTVNAASSYPTANFEEQYFTSGDFNGDGLTDIVGIGTVNTVFSNYTYAYIYYASLNSSGNVQFMTGENFNIASNIYLGNWSQQRGGSSAIDLDGNGVNEFLVPTLVINGSKADISFYYYGSISGRINYTTKYSSEMPLYATGDFNKDGKGDIIYMEKGHNNNKYPGAIVGWNSGTTLYQGAFELTLPSSPEKMFVSDFNGDGLDDMIIFYSGGYTIFWNQGGGISTSTFTDSKKTMGNNFGAGYWTMIRSGDFNGDGLMDFIINDTNDTNWYFALNNGNGTFSRSVACSIYAYDQSSTSSDDDKFECMVFDFDSDGKDDVVITKAMYTLLGKTYTYWMRSDGTTLTQVKSATSNKTDDALSYRYLTGDFNGDGQVELMNYGYDCYNSTNANSNPVWRLYRNSNFSSDAGKVGTITDSYGGRTTISYASFGNGGIYSKGTGSVYPMVDYTIPLYAVKSVTTENGAAGDVTTNYQYSGLKMHLQGKGILGLTSIKTSNTTLGITTESGVKSWNTSFFIPSATYSKTTMDSKIAETNLTLAITDKGSKKYFSYPSTKTEKDLDGNTVTTTFKFNTAYGYQEEEKADFGNNMYKTVQYGSYILAGGSYKPQLITSTQKHTDDAAAFAQETAITYNTTKGYRTKVIENQGAVLQLTVDYTYDNIGNVLTSKESGLGITPVTVNNVYDATYRFLTKTSTIPASSVSSYTYDTWGNILTEKDETLSTNVLTTTHTYDNWGNRTSTVFPDGTKTMNQWGWGIYQSKCYYALTQGTGQPWVKI
ncbi:FG-GAP-like repeat-containing protein [Dysgonomonas sp.]